jgi:hypothetical protein
MEHPGWPQSQEISSVLLESSQRWLQYFLSLTMHWQEGWAHFFVSEVVMASRVARHDPNPCANWIEPQL